MVTLSPPNDGREGEGMSTYKARFEPVMRDHAIKKRWMIEIEMIHFFFEKSQS